MLTNTGLRVKYLIDNAQAQLKIHISNPAVRRQNPAA